MKVGIISINMYSKGLNFACPLHTYAFQQFLSKHKIDSTVIDYKPIYYDNFDLKYPSDYYNRKCISLIGKTAATEEEQQIIDDKLAYYTKKQEKWEVMSDMRATRYDKFQDFIETYYHKTDVCYNSDLLEAMDPGFDCYICATDVIWKKQPNAGFDRGYFLGSRCMENKWKIAYAASRGVYFAESQEDTDLYFHYVKDLDAISVREASHKKYIEDNSDLKAEMVLDPVLLHKSKFYDKLCITPPETNYVLLYYVMEEAKDTISGAVNYARKHHKTIVEITDLPLAHGRLTKFKDIEVIYRYDIGIEEWLGYIRHADCIFTNSFHACCFSILFKKQFYAGSRHGDKVRNVMEMFGLSDRILHPSAKPKTEVKPETIAKPETRSLSARIRRRLSDYFKKCTSFLLPPDKTADKIKYGPVYAILRKRRRESAAFILSALRTAERNQHPRKNYDAYKKTLTYPILYNSKSKSTAITSAFDAPGKCRRLPSGSWEYKPENNIITNNATFRFMKNGFQLEDRRFCGWNVRLRIDNEWFWYLADRSLAHMPTYNSATSPPLYLFQENAIIPYIPVNHISVAVAVAVWKKAVPT